MKGPLRIALLLFVVCGSLADDLGFDLADALGDIDPTPPKPKEQPKEPPKIPEKTGDDGGLDLFDAFGPDPTTKPKPEKPAVNPKPSGGGGDGFDLGDALDGGFDPKPDKPVNPPPSGGGGGGTIDDSDLFDIAGYKPDGGGGSNPAYDPHGGAGGADQPQEAGGGAIAAIVSSVGVALLGAASSYFAYQKKKLCFKLQGVKIQRAGSTTKDRIKILKFSVTSSGRPRDHLH